MERTRRKPFKVMTRRNESDFGCYALNHATLIEVLGYFKTLEAEPVFIYYNNKDRLWYVIDPLVGLAAAKGKSMKLAEEDFTFSSKLEAYRKMKDTEYYQAALAKYNELLKNYMEVNK